MEGIWVQGTLSCVFVETDVLATVGVFKTNEINKQNSNILMRPPH